MTRGWIDHWNGTHLYHLDLSSDASRYSSIILFCHLKLSPHSLYTEGRICEQNIPLSAPYSSCSWLKQHQILIKFPSRLSVEMKAGTRGKRGCGSLCSKGSAIEDLMALSVQSLVRSLKGSRCLFWDDFIPNESELQQSCTQSGAALNSLFVCHRPPYPRRLIHSLTQHWAMCLPTASVWHWCVSQEGCVSCR